MSRPPIVTLPFTPMIAPYSVWLGPANGLLLLSWARKTTCSRRDLESLIGSLHNVCHVVRPGRTFLRRMIDLLCCFHSAHHPIRLNAEFRRSSVKATVTGRSSVYLESWSPASPSNHQSPSVALAPGLGLAVVQSHYVLGGVLHCVLWFSSRR